jgi:DNA-binding SARP family transcriptional activator
MQNMSSPATSAFPSPSPAQTSRHDTRLKLAVFDRFLHGLLIVDEDGLILCGNTSAAQILRYVGAGSRNASCCALLGCAGPEQCPTSLVLGGQLYVPEMRRDLRGANGSHTLWVSAFPLAEDPVRVLLQLRPGDPRDRLRREETARCGAAPLRITTLGHTAIACGEQTIEGGWLDQRPGDLLRYLIVNRGRAVTAEEIGESLWRTPGYHVARNVRTTVHRLRAALEPCRRSREAPDYLLTRGASYRLNLEQVTLDADEFEAGLRQAIAVHGEDPGACAARLETSLSLYRGELFAESPFAEWALLERARLHQLACEALERLAKLRHRIGQPQLARDALERLASLQPLDEHVCRELLALDVTAGRHSDAKRRYDRLVRMMHDSLGYPPRFALSELTRVTDL